MRNLLDFVLLTCLLSTGSYGYFHKRQDQNLTSGNEIVESQKRSIAGLIAKAVFSTAPIASSGLALATAITGGCNYYASICTDKTKIKRLETEIKTLTKTYEKLYYGNRRRYTELLQINIDNKYIILYFNQMLSEIDNQAYLIGNISNVMKLNKAEIIQYLKLSNASEALKGMFTPYEYILRDLKFVIIKHKDSPIIALVVQRVADTLLSRATSYVTYALKITGHLTIKNKNFLAYLVKDKIESKPAFATWAIIKGFFDWTADGLGTTLKNTVEDIKLNNKAVNLINVEKWWKAKIKLNSVSPLQSSVQQVKTSSEKVKDFFKAAKPKLQYLANNYKFMTSVNFAKSIALIVDVIKHSLAAKGWKKVADALSKTKVKYENYKNNLSQEILRLRKESDKMTNLLNTGIKSFKVMVKNIKTIVSTPRKTKFAKLFGIVSTTVYDDVFFQTDFGSVDVNNIKTLQPITQAFMIKMKTTLQAITSEFQARKILLTESKLFYRNDKEIASILSSIKRIMTHMGSSSIKKFGNGLKEKDIVCAIAMTCPNQNEYDFFPLTTFRSKLCKVSDGDILKMKQVADKKRDEKLLYKAVKTYVNRDKPVSEILFFAKELYKSQASHRLKTYGDNLTSRNVVCIISTLYPSLERYDSYELSPFRPDCSRVTEINFQRMEAKSNKLRKGRTYIKFLMNLCYKDKTCICPSKIATNLNLSEADIKQIISEFRPTPSCVYVEIAKKCNWKC